ncbi:unnamed protein product [Linum tenue]|uniref:Uncharacterized protein n=1 Tax=Linum tenue TaxID=586396 RepID=A0AAV0I0E9_9ROSI|nr:unnamed protein product [Linum tenue]
MNLMTIGMFSRAATVRSLYRVINIQGQNMYVGCVTHQLPSNGGENIGCHNKSFKLCRKSF